MTEKLYYNDMYGREFDASVVSVKDNYVVLDKTLFMPIACARSRIEMAPRVRTISRIIARRCAGITSCEGWTFKSLWRLINADSCDWSLCKK